MNPSILKNVDVSKPLKEQQKTDFVCEPGDKRVKRYGWTKSKFRGYISIENQTIWISAIESIQKGKGNFSRLVRNLHKAGYQIKVPSPFPNMTRICEHLGFRFTLEYFKEADVDIVVYVLNPEECIA